MSPSRPLFFPLLAGALAAVFLLQCVFASRAKSVAWDEPGDIAAGLSYWQTGTFTVNLQHPPLLKELSGLSLLAAGARWPDTPEARQLLAGAAQYQWSVGSDILKRSGGQSALFWARLPFILLATGLGILLYIWGRRMLGGAAALGALFLYALDPNVLAHSYLVTLDAGLAAFTVLFCFALWSYLRAPGLRRMLWCGAALGALLAAKFSAVMLLPVAGLLLFAAVYRPPEGAGKLGRGFFNLYGAAVEVKGKTGPNDPCPCGSGRKFKRCHGAGGSALPAGSRLTRKLAVSAAVFGALLLVGALVVEATYFFSADPLLYVRAMRLVNADHAPGYQAYLAGSLSPHFLTYFAAAYLLKEPLASIALVVFGLVLVLRSARLSLLDKLFLLAPPAVLFVAHTVLADDLGIRYIIPVLPFAYLLGGVGLAELAAGPAPWKRAIAAALCLWILVAAAGIYPDHLSYFNESACLFRDPSRIGLDGGSRCGSAWLDDSNVDWGEGLLQLRSWLDRNAPARKIRLAYFGSYPPENYGLTYEPVGLEQLMRAPAPGLYAVSAHLMSRALAYAAAEGSRGADWLRREPRAIVGHCLYIYEIR